MKWLRRIGVTLLVLVVLLGAGYAGLTVASNNVINQTYDVPEIAAIELPTDEAALTEGGRIYVTRGCASCHAEDGGGKVVFEAPPVGYVAGTNLTAGAGGVGGTFSDEDYIRAIRHGVAPDGRGYLLMPSHDYAHYTDDDMGNLIAYIRSLPPVDRDMGDTYFGIITRAFVFDAELGLIAARLIDHKNVTPADVEVAASVEYGEYMVRTCTGCHGANLSGGPLPAGDPDPPPASNLTFHETGMAGWTLDELDTLLRTGVNPDGTQLDPAYMPWPAFSQLTDVEIEAIYLYLESVDPLPYNTD